jgi:hypothetical protein
VSRLPDAIHVRVSSRDQPLAQLLVLTRIVMHDGSDYWGIFGPTGPDGSLEIQRAELARTAAATRAFNQEAYSDVESHLSGLIEVRVLDEAGLDRALEAAAALPDYPYEPGYVDKLQTARAALITLGRVLMEVEVTAAGGDCEVKAAEPI